MQYRIRDLVIVIMLLLFSVAAFFPMIINNDAVYNYVKASVVVLLLLLSVSTKCYKAIAHPFVLWYFSLSMVIGFMLFAFYAFGLRIKWGDFISIVICLWAIALGYSIHLNDRGLDACILVFSMVSVILGISSMFYYVGSLTLTDYLYYVETKNMVGQLVASSGIGVVAAFQARKNSRFLKLSLVVMTLVLLLLLHCKTAFVAFLLFLPFFLRKQFNSGFILVSFFAAVLLIVFFYDKVVSFLDLVFVGTRDVADLNDLSSGRIERNVDGLRFFASNPLFGEMKTASDVENIHNYLIKRLAAYGVFCIPFIILYFKFGFKTIKDWLHAEIGNLRNAGLFMLFIPFFSSLLEPSAPFGPGLLQLIPFFFYGIYLKNTVGVRPVTVKRQ